MDTFLRVKNEKNEKIFDCKKCDFMCSYISDWNRHILTDKHKRKLLETTNHAINEENECKNHDCLCGKTFKAKSGLWKHKKKCTIFLNSKNNDELLDKQIDFEVSTNKEDIVMLLMKENSEFKNLLVEQNKMMMDMMKNSVVNNTNINNINQNNINQTNNKTFNLQFFLNETCKDAMNISEFIDNISLQLSDLESLGHLGYVEGISKIIIKNLKALDIEKRPVHCSDIKREIMYVKDQDKWEKEVSDKNKIKQVISAVVSKNLGLLPEFQKKYPECMNPESKKSDEYNQIIMEAMGGGAEAGIKNKEKIVRKIAKEVAIDKE
jgi:hypothetical protein